MQVIELPGVFKMDTGAPMPLVISNDNRLTIMFHLDEPGHNVAEPADLVQQLAIMRFDGCIQYSFGAPNNETLYGHPYYRLGLRSYGFYEVQNSDWITRVKNIQKVHPYYNESSWQDAKHYIITFHDNTLECIANGFRIERRAGLMADFYAEVMKDY